MVILPNGRRKLRLRQVNVVRGKPHWRSRQLCTVLGQAQAPDRQNDEHRIFLQRRQQNSKDDGFMGEDTTASSAYRPEHWNSFGLSNVADQPTNRPNSQSTVARTR